MRGLSKLSMGTMLLAMVMAACGPPTAPTSPSSAPIVAPADTAAPTDTPAPTSTPKPTNTPKPTKTPLPTPTYTPTPAPIALSGQGDSVVDVEKWDGPALVHITYAGSGNFTVWNYGADGEKIELLVNIIGKYDGTRPLDFLDGEQTTRFQIEASGQWQIQILPLQQIRRVEVPGTFEGKGDEVVFLDGDTPDLLKIDASKAESNFAIWGFGDSRDLLVNEIAPYDGVVIIGADMKVLVIEAEGDWSIEVTVR